MKGAQRVIAVSPQGFYLVCFHSEVLSLFRVNLPKGAT